ncbi:GNAT family N-acetyltransferase [Nonlabens agnitus]|uniref:Uncharacterized protein n=1 Tax=Nonlabens agnitus TaxID=870484 RepID=A0A2S9WQM8_9FLAO|nr:GNAT family N-acetyltransferase [Nonlabens agnitus]PRP65769.1 hypothetical protein BST86_01000 [Nonlabens agnitus]
MQITLYTPQFKDQWDQCVRESHSGCFLHERDFMEYHAHRFEDHSLMFFDNDTLVACFPAHIIDNNLKSHRGLTYGGFFASAKANLFSDFLQELIDYSKNQGFDRLDLKLPPQYYNPNFNAEWSVLKNNSFETSQESVDLVVDLTQEWQPSPKKTIGYRNGKFEKLKLIKDVHLKDFWSDLLEPQLMARHQARPVHSIEEIELLQKLFPDQILQYGVEVDDMLVAGITLFDFGNILKVQYAAANKQGFEHNAMDFLYLEIIKEAKEQKKEFVDLGTVNHPDGSVNEGLKRFKQQLGATTTSVFELTLSL